MQLSIVMRIDTPDERLIKKVIRVLVNNTAVFEVLPDHTSATQIADILRLMMIETAERRIVGSSNIADEITLGKFGAVAGTDDLVPIDLIKQQQQCTSCDFVGMERTIMCAATSWYHRNQLPLPL